MPESSPALSGSITSGATVSPVVSLYLIQVNGADPGDRRGGGGGGGHRRKGNHSCATIYLYAYSSTSISNWLEQQPVKCTLSDRKDFYWSLDS